MIRWEIKRQSGENGYRGWVGKVPLFSVDFDPQNKDHRWRVHTILPGLSPVLGNFSSNDEAFKVAEGNFNNWLKETGLTTGGNK